MKKHRVLELHGTTHGSFIFEPKHQKIPIAEILRFLA